MSQSETQIESKRAPFLQQNGCQKNCEMSKDCLQYLVQTMPHQELKFLELCLLTNSYLKYYLPYKSMFKLCLHTQNLATMGGNKVSHSKIFGRQK